MAKWNIPEGKIYTQADLDRALAAQRERCAKVAEAHVDNEDSYGPDFDAGWEAAAFAIAAAIRAQK